MTPGNGSLKLLEQIREMTEGKGSKIATRDIVILMLKSQEYIIARMNAEADCNSTRDEAIKELKKKNLVMWAQANPKFAVLLMMGVAVINGFVNWESLRKPILQGLAKHILGIDVPLEIIP